MEFLDAEPFSTIFRGLIVIASVAILIGAGIHGWHDFKKDKSFKSVATELVIMVISLVVLVMFFMAKLSFWVGMGMDIFKWIWNTVLVPLGRSIGIPIRPIP